MIGMVGNFAVARYKARVAKQIQSTTMDAEATHSCLDTVSSLGALMGLIGVGMGYRWADPLAGFVVTLFIAHVGFEVTREIVHHLMDGVEPEHLDAARRAAQTVPAYRVQACVVAGWAALSPWKSKAKCPLAPPSSRPRASGARSSTPGTSPWK